MGHEAPLQNRDQAQPAGEGQGRPRPAGPNDARERSLAVQVDLDGGSVFRVHVRSITSRPARHIRQVTDSRLQTDV